MGEKNIVIKVGVLWVLVLISDTFFLSPASFRAFQGDLKPNQLIHLADDQLVQ